MNIALVIFLVWLVLVTLIILFFMGADDGDD